MFSCRDALIAALLAVGVAAQAQTATYPGVGRAATPNEVAAWDIDVRPDFKGLPKGQGSVAKGMEVWEGKCASCHGVFGESNQVFSPIAGGTTKDDIKTGRVARLDDNAYPGRTTLMKLPYVATLWDYINRAMPWTAPKTLTADEVYAVTAFILSLGGIVADDFTLSNENIADVQKLLPNRNGMTTDHALWPGAQFGTRKPDVVGVACMKDCADEPKLASYLPDHARDAHGNLAQQNRVVGAQQGVDTTKPPATAPAGGTPRAAAAATAVSPRAAAMPAAPPAPHAAPANAATPAPAAAAAKAPAAGGGAAALAAAQKAGCVACHGVQNKILGPAFADIAKKYAGRADAPTYLAGKIKNGSAGVWGAIPMPAQSLADADAKLIAQWLAQGLN